MNYHILIVDTEQSNRQFIHETILEHLPHATLYGTHSLEDAEQYLLNNKTDLVFIEIKLPGKLTGLEFVQTFSHRNFEVVFMSAYAEYAIQAVRSHAFDYLLKPFKKTDFVNVIDRFVDTMQEKNHVATTNHDTDHLPAGKIGITYQGGIRYVSLDDIIYLEANNSYTMLYLVNNECITASKPINKFEEKLVHTNFFRIHKSHIINIAHFTEYSSKNGEQAVMSNGMRLTISRYRLSDFLGLIDDTIGKLKI
jgi:two-component system LytT family response regulator